MAVKKLFETARLLVREYQPGDLETIQEYAGQPDVVRYQSWGPNTQEDTYRFFIETQESRMQSPRVEYPLCIERKEDGRQIGGCEIDMNGQVPQEATIGYIIHPRYWNQGYATEVTQGAIAFAQRELAVTLLQATCDSRNLASRRVLEKSGFTLERVIENDFLQKGEMRTTLVFKLTL